MPLVRDLLAKSGFELLFPRAGQANAVWLRTQRRMPIEIASFVSETFYSGRLRTEHDGSGPNAVFRSPFAFVDTADRSRRERAETAMSRLGTDVRHGYRNELEARIITDLVVALGPQFRDWAVIVPFNAQKDLVIEHLCTVLGSSTLVADNVGTVDSFQGGERDLVVFGFTRSNPVGGIGFLRELRRFNVAVTRARRQLVLVGDLATLCVAKDPGFEALMHSMCDHLGRSGVRRPSRDVAAALESGSEQRS
jgi:superfamily I DNA and/or RNA helicase